MNEIHLTDDEMKELATTAARGNVTVEDLVAVAAWAFASQGEPFKESYVREVSFGRRPGRSRARPRRQSLKEKLHGLARRFISAFG
jgi:hypothetical protein